MRKAFVSICVLLLFLATCSQPFMKSTTTLTESTLNTEKVEPKEDDSGYYFERIQEEVILTKEKVAAEQEISTMTKEIKDFWIYYYGLDKKCEGCKKAWPIRNRHREAFNKHSRQLAEIVYYFKRNDADMGGRLPMHKDTAVFLAMMVVKETAVDPKARGALGEVGLIQIHKEALRGHTSREVLDNPRLGLFLGVNWVASKFKTCRRSIDINNWNNKMWYKPITIYAAGEGKGRAKRGKCTDIGVARQRVNLAIRYLDTK